MQREPLAIDNGDGWSISLTRFWRPGTTDPTRPPVVFFPGYAMNSSILSFHPEDISLVESVVAAGFPVWTADLRGQGASRPHRRPARFGFREIVRTDVSTAIATVLDRSGADRLHAVGCSLGASYLYAWRALHPQDQRLATLTALGGPLRWDETHPAMRIAFASPRLAGLPRIRGTRAMARLGLPFAKRLPKLLSIYMNTDQIDLRQADQLVQVVEDPVPWLNRQIGRWMQQRDLVVDGVNVSEALAAAPLPVHCIMANRDGIVPPAAANAVASILGPEHVTELMVGDERVWFAHADLFIARSARQRVFDPLCGWLLERS